MSRRPFCIVCSIKPHAFPIPSFSPSSLAHFLLSVSRVVMAAPQRLTLWLTVALGLLQLNCAVSDDPTDPNKIVGHINYTPPRLGQN